MNANYKSIILAISLFFALSASISAAPGDLDPSFGSGGIVITRGGLSGPDYALGMAIQSDGKIVVVGLGITSTTGDFAVVRYNTDGSLDSSFGGTGIVITPVGNSYDEASSVAIQADGKIVVAGGICNGVGDCSSAGTSLAVVRYNPNGSLDTSFNGTGKVITQIGDAPSIGFTTSTSSVAIQSDGKIIAARYNGYVRYNPNGSLDTSFNGTGKIITPFGSASSVVIQTDGKFVVAGSNYNGSSQDFAVARYNTDGSLDSSFNGTGIVITPVGNSSGAVDLAIQLDGQIVVVGYSQGVSNDFRTADFAVVRYNPDGSLDTSFGGTGKIIIPIGGFADYANSVAIQADGKIVVAGNSEIGDSGRNFVVVRFNPNGSLNTTFNGTGKVTTPFCCQSYAIAVAIQADGKIVVAGATDDYLDGWYDFVVVRYQGGGGSAPDPAACPNRIDCNEFFVRQHYRDFFNREPDDAGLAFWTNAIMSCGAEAQCVEAKRINVSAAFFLSIEFQETGYLAYRIYKAAYGDTSSPNVAIPVPIIRLNEFLPDAQRLGQGVQVGIGDWQGQLEANKNSYVREFVTRQRFLTAYPLTMPAVQFVDQLNQNAGNVLLVGARDQLVAELGAAADVTVGRASVLRRVAENAELRQQELNRAFVLMQYYGYLRRNPNDAPDADFGGWKFWLDKLNQFNGNFIHAEMVKAFLVSQEYRGRFGSP